MSYPKPIGDEKIAFQGRIIEIVHQPHQVGEKVIDFETARRSPGVRMILVEDGKILLTKEYRAELGGDDYRLPGGKVFDRLEDYNTALKNGADLVGEAKEALKREALEETGHVVTEAKHIHTTSPGATISWDLYYFVVDQFAKHEHGQELEDGEVIEPLWMSFDEVKELCLSGEVKEERTAAVLLRFLDNRF
ncbi:MAG: NUDIX hydrolase [Parcubacteria group bacterium]|nr:NUDIX hydrolase [Parcubacteria group bacterium]